MCIQRPLVTIVTVSYNTQETIEDTILSVINQTYSNLEYIIIDGGSTDKTIEIIKKYDEKISHWISEPDKGIYNAMNKAIKYSTGEWCIFMNSGDVFFNDNVLSNIFENSISNFDVIYGATLVNYKWGKYIVSPGKIKNLKNRMPFCHQSCLVRTSILKKYGFNENFKITADHKLLKELYLNRKKFYQYQNVISVYDSIYGLSSTNPLLLNVENNPDRNSSKMFFIKRIITYSEFIILKILPYFMISSLYKLYFSINIRYKKQYK